MDDLSNRLAKLSPEKMALLVEGLSKKKGPSNAQAAPRRKESSDAPLSFGQQRLYFLSKYEPELAIYNVPVALRLAGELNLKVLEQGINSVVRRHKSLSTIISVVGGGPVQVILEPKHLAVPLIDLDELSRDKREVCARQLASGEAQRIFDLEAGPLFRASLLRLGEEEHVLLLTMHHIITDGWSIQLLLRELAEFYNATSMRRPFSLPDIPIQFADFACWQREWLRGEVSDRQLSYWKRQLGGSPSFLNLPTDRPRPRVSTFKGGHRSIELEKDLSEAIKLLGVRRGATLFITLLAAFQSLLYRYTGQEDILVGTGVAGRNFAEVEPLIGFFVNTLALRADLSGNPSFHELIRRVKEVVLEAHAHQDLPFDRIVEEVLPERDLSRAPLFQVMFSLENRSPSPIDFAGLQLSSFEYDFGTAKVDMTLFMWESANRIGGVLEYNTDLFEQTSISRMLLHFTNLLKAVVANPDIRLIDIPLEDCVLNHHTYHHSGAGIGDEIEEFNFHG